MKHLKNRIPMKSQVRIYVPSTINVDQVADTEEWVNKTLHLLSTAFGGATTTDALGAWLTSDGKLVREKINICFSFACEKNLQDEIDNIYDHCLRMKIELGQESVALELNGEMYFI